MLTVGKSSGAFAVTGRADEGLGVVEYPGPGVGRAGGGDDRDTGPLLVVPSDAGGAGRGRRGPVAGGVRRRGGRRSGQMLEPCTLRFADRLVGALLEAGADEEQAAWTAWTVVYFVLGLVQEEQAAPDRPDDRLTRAVDPAAHPAPHRVTAHSRPGAFEDRSAFGLDAILSPTAGVTHRAAVTPPGGARPACSARTVVGAAVHRVAPGGRRERCLRRSWSPVGPGRSWRLVAAPCGPCS